MDKAEYQQFLTAAKLDPEAVFRAACNASRAAGVRDLAEADRFIDGYIKSLVKSHAAETTRIAQIVTCAAADGALRELAYGLALNSDLSAMDAIKQLEAEAKRLGLTVRRSAAAPADGSDPYAQWRRGGSGQGSQSAHGAATVSLTDPEYVNGLHARFRGGER